MRFGSQDVAFQLRDKLDCVPVPHAFIIPAFGGGGGGARLAAGPQYFTEEHKEAQTFSGYWGSMCALQKQWKVPSAPSAPEEYSMPSP